MKPSLSEQQKDDMATSKMEEGPVVEESSKPVLFPTPKYCFNIFSPRQITTSEKSVEQQNLIKSGYWKNFTTSSTFHTTTTDETTMTTTTTSTSTTSTPNKKKVVVVKLSSLIVKMLNRFIKEKFLPREAIYILIGQSHIFVQILCSASALPILMQKCEHIGVGNVIGACFACPVETSRHPSPGPNMQLFDLSQIATVSDKPLPSTGEMAEPATEENGDEDYISSDEEEEAEEKDKDTSVPSSVNISLLSEPRKKLLKQKIIDARNEWLQTASRIRVEQVAEEVRANAAMTWDYLMFVLCAATVAAVGLATDSATTTIASMLISPIMGPVLCFTFGTTIRRKELVVVGLRNEVLSLLICLLVGCFWGIIATVSNTSETRNWPSQEMIGRGDPYGLVSGILIALPSGAATALSTLGRNSSGMTGVAISLSLLPPAVNAGICWIYAAMLNSPRYQRNDGDETNYVVTGGISLALSAVNILCIWLAGVITFKLKEVAPVAKKNAFWSRDIKNYREKEAGVTPAVDTEVINEGIQAALELQQDAGKDIYEGDFEIDLSKNKVGAARREGLAANAWEDALFVDQDFGLEGKVVVGGAAADVIPDQTTLENIKRRKTATASLVQNANQLGGLGEAGEALFDNNLLQGVDDSLPLPSDADGVNHEDVAKKILLQKYE